MLFIRKITTVLTLICLLSQFGCANLPRHKQDPFVEINHPLMAINITIDYLYLRPMSKLYHSVIPDPIISLIDHFMENVQEIPNTANNLLQGKGKGAAISTGRFIINSSLGVFGFFEVAQPLGLERQREDLGQTLAEWGWTKSSYIVLPILGPSTVRDTLGMLGQLYLHPVYYTKPRYRNPYAASYVIHNRTKYFEFEQITSATSIFKYVVIRDAYLQNRGFEVTDHDDSDVFLGEPPE